MTKGAEYRSAGESARAWVLRQISDDDGPWLPSDVTDERVGPPDIRDTLHSGIAGLAFLLQEVALARTLTIEEELLREAIAYRLSRAAAAEKDPSLYFGATGMCAALHLLGADDADPVLRRIAACVSTDGWPSSSDEDDDAEYVFNDVLLGAAGAVMAGIWTGSDAGAALATAGAEALLQTATATDAGLDWPAADPIPFRMPNYSHGTAGCAAALAVAGAELKRPDFTAAAVAGARHLVSIADMSDQGFRVVHYVPERDNDEEPFTYSWCHGPAGTSFLFAALQRAGIDEVSGFTPGELRRRALRSLLTSGIPRRLRPGFWDNDGRCCGTAGVGDVLLDAAQDETDSELGSEYLRAATIMADALMDRAITDDAGTRWRFTEHRNDDPLLPPGTGWMQGAAGIAAFLMRISRVLDEGVASARVVDRPDQFWAVPARLRTIKDR